MDYTSLESKIRKVMEDAHNTALRRKVTNVARPTDAKPDDAASKLAKQAEIKTKIIDENLGYESQASKNKPNETDKKDAKEIKGGGKTEVELDPKTDDKIGDESDETQKGKKATSKANKEIGAKGAGPVKEETMSGKLTFGSSESQIKAVTEAMKMMRGCATCGKKPCQCDGDPKKMKEELIGGQKKLDKNHNGKLDADDFKKLRKEEVESVEEAAYSAKAARAGKDIGKPGKNFEKIAKKAGKEYGSAESGKKVAGAILAKIRAKHMGEEVESIDELSRKTLNTYAQKADKQLTTVNAVGPSHKAGIPGHYKGKNKELGKDPVDKMKARKAGIDLAVKKLNKEEVEFSEAEIARIESILKDL